MSNLSTADVDIAYDEPPVESAPTPVEVRRNGALSGGIGVIGAVVALAYLTRALGDGGSALDWVLALGMGGLAAAYLSAFVDARTPLMIVDDQGVRVRRGREWHGLRWDAVEVLEHQPRRGPLRDGRLVVVPVEHGREFSVALSLSTFVAGDGGDLTLALEQLAADPAQVVEVVDAPVEYAEEYAEDHAEDHADEPVAEERVEDEPAQPLLPDPRPTVARGIGFLADRLRPRREVVQDVEPEPEIDSDPEPTVAVVASAPPLPLRDPVGGARVEMSLSGPVADETVPPVDPELTQSFVLPAIEEPVDDEVAYVADPVIGPVLVAARSRLRLSVDQLAERTRIRPHVIESIEVDDFVPCGGDFYARGHLRTLARVLGLDAAPLLAAYDERYADAPIDARRVFEAELATGEGGPIRSMRGGPNWSVLIAAVMALVLAWSIARLIMDSPVELESKPVLNGSPSSPAKLGSPVPVVLDAATGGTHVVVLDGAGEQVFSGDLAFGEQKTVRAAPPVRVQASDGGLQVTVDGKERGAVGSEGEPAQNTFAAAD